MIERSTTVERVADAIRQEILIGRISPGSPLREQDLVGALGVSRGTIREAISVLVNEGLLTRESYRGATVAKLTEADIRDLFAVRRLIELAAVAALPHAAQRQRDELTAAERELARVFDLGDNNTRNEADVRIHVALVAALGSPRLSRIHGGVMTELRLALVAAYEDQDEELPGRHHEFIALVDAGDVEGAKAHLLHRLDLAEEELLAAVRQKAEPTG
jgi:DNA-binding GntR family transcriptional regulator